MSVLVNKLNDVLVARLSELGEPKIGQLTFHFAAIKLGALSTDVNAFQSFVSRHKFHEKRNYDISHKQLPEKCATTSIYIFLTELCFEAWHVRLGS